MDSKAILVGLILSLCAVSLSAASKEVSIPTSEGTIKHKFKDRTPYPAKNEYAQIALVNLLTDNKNGNARWAFSVRSTKTISDVKLYEVASSRTVIPINKQWTTPPFHHLQGNNLAINDSNYPQVFAPKDSLLVFQFIIEFDDETKTTLFQPWVLNRDAKSFLLDIARP